MKIIDPSEQAQQLTDDTRPTVPLCWEEQDDTMYRCDRKQGHLGKHSWQLVQELDALTAEIALHGSI